MYKLRHGAGGSVEELYRMDGDNSVVVPLDVENQDFCDFLTWDNHQDHPLDPGISPVRRAKTYHYFSDITRLIEHCQQSGYMVFAYHEVAGSPKLEFGVDIPYQSQNGLIQGVFKTLCKTVEDPNRLYHQETSGIDPSQTNICISPGLGAAVHQGITEDDSDIRKLVSCPIKRAFVYIDVSDFSTLPPGQQALVINSIISIVDKEAWNPDVDRDYEAKLCIGDGYIFVLRSALQAVQFASQLALLIEVLGAKKLLPVEFHFRMGVHIGEVYCFWDTGRRGWNFIGDGINGGQRVLASIGKESDDVVFISGETRREIIAGNKGNSPYRVALANMTSRGRKADKHGKMWRVFELNPRGITRLLTALDQ